MSADKVRKLNPQKYGSLEDGPLNKNSPIEEVFKGDPYLEGIGENRRKLSFEFWNQAKKKDVLR